MKFFYRNEHKEIAIFALNLATLAVKPIIFIVEIEKL
jgi:hypothetical protein